MSDLWIRRAVCHEFTHSLKSSMRGNTSLAPRFGAFFSRPNGIVELLVFFCLAPLTPYKQIVELFFDECRQKILNRNCLVVRTATRIAKPTKEMIRFLGQINQILHKWSRRTLIDFILSHCKKLGSANLYHFIGSGRNCGRK